MSIPTKHILRGHKLRQDWQVLRGEFASPLTPPTLPYKQGYHLIIYNQYDQRQRIISSTAQYADVIEIKFTLDEHGCRDFELTIPESLLASFGHFYRIDVHPFLSTDPWFSGYVTELPVFVGDTFSIVEDSSEILNEIFVKIGYVDPVAKTNYSCTIFDAASQGLYGKRSATKTAPSILNDADALQWGEAYIDTVKDPVKKIETGKPDGTCTIKGKGFYYLLDSIILNGVTEKNKLAGVAADDLAQNYICNTARILYDPALIEDSSYTLEAATGLEFNLVSISEALDQLSLLAGDYIYGVNADRYVFFQAPDVTIHTRRWVGIHRLSELWLPNTSTPDFIQARGKQRIFDRTGDYWDMDIKTVKYTINSKNGISAQLEMGTSGGSIFGMWRGIETQIKRLEALEEINVSQLA